VKENSYPADFNLIIVPEHTLFHPDGIHIQTVRAVQVFDEIFLVAEGEACVPSGNALRRQRDIALGTPADEDFTVP
jgi:hypothetical protein